MKVRTWNPHLYPPSGFILTDEDGVTHRGTSVLTLATEIAEYRIRRELPPGNPVAEVNEYLCRKYPSRCYHHELPTEEVLVRTKANTVMAGVALWLRETWRLLSLRKVAWVRKDEVVRVRVETCQACPWHQNVTQDCPVCQESQNQISFQLRAGRDRLSSGLATCTHYQRDVRVDVLLEQPPDANAPEKCWKRPTLLEL